MRNTIYIFRAITLANRPAVYGGMQVRSPCSNIDHSSLALPNPVSTFDTISLTRHSLLNISKRRSCSLAPSQPHRCQGLLWRWYCAAFGRSLSRQPGHCQLDRRCPQNHADCDILHSCQCKSPNISHTELNPIAHPQWCSRRCPRTPPAPSPELASLYGIPTTRTCCTGLSLTRLNASTDPLTGNES